LRLGRELDAIWAQRMPGLPLRVVVGETWLAGNVSVRSRHQPMVYIDANPAKSPWIHAAMLRDCGALLVVDRRDLANPLDPRVSDLLAQAGSSGELQIPWTRRETGPQLEVEWAILAPQRAGACPP